MKKSKLFIGVLTSLTLIASTVATSFADESVVSKTQDNITITKSAEWTTYNGKSEDENGNKYAKINFKIDTTKATTEVTEKIKQGGDTDIVLVLDDSGSMNGTKTQKLRAAAKSFVDEMAKVTDVNVRVGIVSFASSAKTLSPLTKDTAALTASLSSLKANGGTNLAPGIEAAKALFTNNQVVNKFYVILSDGDVYDAKKSSDLLDAEKNSGNKKGTKVITIGYDTDAGPNEFLKKIASNKETKDPTTGAVISSTPMFYNAEVNATSLVADLKSVFEQIEKEIKKYLFNSALVDTIPAEFSIVEETISTSDSNLVANVSEDKKTITWSWGDTNKLENKIYEMSLITVLDKSKEGTYTKVNTNGTTIDPNADTSKSAIFTYDANKELCLASPKLTLKTEVVDEKTPAASTPAGNDSAKTDETPKTGDALNTGIILLVALCGVATVISGVAIKRRKRCF